MPETATHMSVHGNNMYDIYYRNDGAAGLGPMVRLQFPVTAWVDLRTLFSGVGLTPKRLLSRPNPHHWGPCNPDLGLAS